MDYARESIASVWDEARDMTVAHVSEVGSLGAEGFAPSRELYEKLEAAGVAHVYTMRTTPIHEGVLGQLVGYAVFHLMPHHHYGGMWATQDAVYVLPEYRGGAAVRFMAWTDLAMKADGAKHVLRHSTIKKDYGRTLMRMGYRLNEISFIKEL